MTDTNLTYCVISFACAVMCGLCYWMGYEYGKATSKAKFINLLHESEEVKQRLNALHGTVEHLRGRYQKLLEDQERAAKEKENA